MRAPPPYVRVSARWWGDDLVADAARPWVGLDSARDADATFVFPVVAKPAGFARYCRDAAMLALEFADGRTGRVAAVASVDVARLDLGRPVLGARALRTRGGATVGSVRVEMRVDFRPDRVSSFERNERLAEAECAETNAGSDTASSEDVFDDDVEGDAERVDADENGASPTKRRARLRVRAKLRVWERKETSRPRRPAAWTRRARVLGRTPSSPRGNETRGGGERKRRRDTRRATPSRRARCFAARLTPRWRWTAPRREG
jgi:hypothetical protein